jgi:predicted TIM-barrel fold metal-dependent hydrolase
MMDSILTIERVLDVDSHERVPGELRDEIFGPTALVAASKTFGIRKRYAKHGNQTSMPDRVGDVTPIDYDSVWKLKGPYAPSAIDMARRPEVLDAMGIDRQLVYPTFGLMALKMFMDTNAHAFFDFDPKQYDHRELGLEGIEAHNRWAVRTTKGTNNRARPVGMVLTESIEGMIHQTEQLISEGIRALMIPANNPPGGTSPADPALDPFWRMTADANVPVTIHLGTEFDYLKSAAWYDNVDVFNPSSQSTLEFVIEPFRASSMHDCAENFLTALVLGGVFERHPTLRFGIIELSATWVGPLAERLDMWVEKQFRNRFDNFLSMRPSEYINRNVRVTPFHFEPVDLYFERYPNLQNVFCYSTDYPHVEGGKESQRIFAETLRGATADLRDKFFYRNGALLLPE